MARCSNCNKTVAFGRSVSHSKRATHRAFRPNLQRVTVMKNGGRVRETWCAKCIKSLSKLR